AAVGRRVHGLARGAGPAVEAGLEAAVADEVRVGRTGGRRDTGGGQGDRGGEHGEQSERSGRTERGGAVHTCLRRWGRWRCRTAHAARWARGWSASKLVQTNQVVKSPGARRPPRGGPVPAEPGR